jgi:hypothetical protein
MHKPVFGVTSRSNFNSWQWRERIRAILLKALCIIPELNISRVSSYPRCLRKKIPQMPARSPARSLRLDWIGLDWIGLDWIGSDASRSRNRLITWFVSLFLPFWRILWIFHVFKRWESLHAILHNGCHRQSLRSPPVTLGLEMDTPPFQFSSEPFVVELVWQLQKGEISCKTYQKIDSVSSCDFSLTSASYLSVKPFEAHALRIVPLRIYWQFLTNSINCLNNIPFPIPFSE